MIFHSSILSKKISDGKCYAVRPLDINESVVVGEGGLNFENQLGVGLAPEEEFAVAQVANLLPGFMQIDQSRQINTLSVVENPTLDIEAQPRENLLQMRVELAAAIVPSATTYQVRKYRFYNFYHPYVNSFLEKLFTQGFEGVFGNLGLQQEGNFTFFENRYGNPDISSTVVASYPNEEVTFALQEAYGLYNWELFFHVPLFVANRLSQEQKFAEAQSWYHYIFDPTNCAEGNPPQCYWRVLPFFKYNLNSIGNRPIQELIELITKGHQLTLNQVRAWQENPFDPHAIAEARIIAYQKNVVMKYLDNLIAWGDQLFRRDSIESINEATQLYLLALEVLGPRPTEIKSRHDLPAKTYEELEEEGIGGLSNVLFELEENITTPTGFEFPLYSDEVGNTGSSRRSIVDSVLYFCVPKNDKLLGYWDIVEDRLFKIRHCMNIEGITRQLALFEPPIDPALLVKAFASGVDISSALSALNAPLPLYRFQYYLGKALEMAAEVKNLGNLLLAALEKRDAEALALLNAEHQSAIFNAIENVRKLQEKEAKHATESLEKAKIVVEERFKFYDEIESFNEAEISQLILKAVAGILEIGTTWLQLGSKIAVVAAPDININPVTGVPMLAEMGGGQKTSKALEYGSIILKTLASLSDREADISGVLGNIQRRNEEYGLQAKLAKLEIAQIDEQIAAATIREKITEKERKNNLLQYEQAKEIESLMRSKYTNQELYLWMVSQVSGLFYRSYQLAFDLAKRAEKAYQFELAEEESSFIEFGYWDSLKKGLLSGEKLFYDLKRMDSSYLERNRRDYEITQSFSLQQLNPFALIQLRQTGECEFEVSELAFDLLYPGQYFRRIKSVSITFPCVTGPYTNVSARLSLVRSRIRIKSQTSQYTYTGINDPNFRHNLVGIQSIAASNGLNDSGLFELNFQDERYLPFEGAGAISSWRLDLPTEFHPFDYNTISDVILTISYTAREGGDRLKIVVQNALVSRINQWLDELAENTIGIPRQFNLKQEFSETLHRLKTSTGDEVSAELILNRRHFPSWLTYGATQRSIEIIDESMQFLIQEGNSLIAQSGFTLTQNSNTEEEPPFGAYTLAGTTDINLAEIKNFIILFNYRIV